MYDRGTVWWGPAPHKDTPSYRPWLVLSTDDHPFAREECIVAAMTTTAHDAGIEVSTSAWTDGGSDVKSYVSPWYVATLKYSSFDRKQGRIRTPLVERVASKLHSFVPVTSA